MEDQLLPIVAPDLPALPGETTGPPHDGLGATACGAYPAEGARRVWAIADQAVVSGANFLTSVLIGHACDPQSLGVYYMAFGLVLFARGVQERIITTPYMVYHSRRHGRCGATYAGSTLVHQALMSAVSVAGLLGLAAVLGHSRQPMISPAVIWGMVAALPLLLLREYMRHFLFAHLDFRRAAILDATVAAVQLGGLAVLAWLRLLTVPSAYLTIAGGCAVACAIWFLVRKDPMAFDLRRVRGDWRENWRFGKWLLASQIVSSLAPLSMPWLLARSHGTAATGELAACSTLVGVVNVLLLGLANQLTPEASVAFAHGGKNALRSVLRRAMVIFAVVIGGLSVAFLAIGGALVTVVYGSHFAGTGALLGILALGLLAGSVEVVAGNGLWAVDRPGANLSSDFTNLLVALAVFALLQQSLGPLAVAWALFAGSAAGAVVRCKTLSNILKGIRIQDVPAEVEHANA